MTKVPWPGRVSTRPRVVSHLIASRTVLRDALYWSLSSPSVASWLPWARSPDSILFRRSSAIWRYSGSGTGPPRDPNQPDEEAGWPQVDHSLDQGYPNIWNEPGFARLRAGIAPVRPKGWDDREGLIHADHTSSPTAWMHQDSPTGPQHLPVRYDPYRTDNLDRSLPNPALQARKVRGNTPW